MKDIVSVVTICFNSEVEIEKTLKSVLQQDYKLIEYVIKDGNSTDRTNEIVRKYQSEFQSKGFRFNHIISADQGIYDAMNMAVENCQGDWIIFMNAGDIFYNNKVLSDIFEHKDWDEADAVYGHTLFQLSDKQGIIGNHNADLMEKRGSMCHQSLFVRKEILQKFPFDCRFKIAADFDQILKLKKKGYIFRRVNTIVAIMNRDGVSTKCIALRNKEFNQLIDKYNLEWNKKPIVMNYIKQFVRGIFPKLEIFCFVKSYLEATVQFEDVEG